MLNVASGATWVSIHHGGGVGIGFSQHAGMVVVCDGTPDAARRLERVLTNDPASGVMRHADAGYRGRDRLRPGARAEIADARVTDSSLRARATVPDVRGARLTCNDLRRSRARCGLR